MVAPYSQKDIIIFHFDQLAGTYSSRYIGQSALAHGFRVHMERVCELFDKTHACVLDVGCGSGHMVDWLVHQGCQVYGVDISKGMINVCVEQFKDMDNAHFAVSAIENLPFGDHSFDAVICKGVLDFVEDDSVAIAELARVVKADGTIIFTLQNLLSLGRVWAYRIATLRSPDNIRRRSYRVGAFVTRLQSYDLIVEDVLYCNFQLFLKPFDRLFPGPAVWVAQKLEKFCRSNFLGWMASGFVIKAKKQ